MRNKKTILSLVALVMVVSICVFAFAGCNNNNNASLTEVLSLFAEESVEVSVHNVDITETIGNDSIFTRNNEMIVTYSSVSDLENGVQTTYRLINGAKNQVVATSSSVIRQLSGLPVFYYTDATLQKTYYYDKTELIYEADSSRVNADGTFKNETYFAQIDGEIKLVNRTLQFTYDMYANSLIQTGDMYYAYNSGILVVFNSAKNYPYIANISEIVNNYPSKVFPLSNGYVLIQTRVPLSENEALRDFDFYSGTTYYNLNTYVYDLAAQSYTQIEFNAYVSDTRLSDIDATALTVNEINADKRLANSKMIFVDHNLNKVIDLDAYMTNVTDFKVLDGKYIALTDGFTVKLYNNDLLEKSAYLAKDFGEDFVQLDNDYYNAKGDAAFIIDDQSTLLRYDSTNYVVYYQSEAKAFAHDLKSNQTYIFNGTPSFNTNVFTVVDDYSGLTKVCSMYDASQITDKEYASVSVFNSGDCAYITATEENGARHIILSYVG